MKGDMSNLIYKMKRQTCSNVYDKLKMINKIIEKTSNFFFGLETSNFYTQKISKKNYGYSQIIIIIITKTQFSC